MAQSRNFSHAIAYVISVPHTVMDTCNKTIEIHVCKLSVGLEKLKFCKIMYVNVKSNWFMVNVGPSSYGCTSEVAKHSRCFSLA